MADSCGLHATRTAHVRQARRPQGILRQVSEGAARASTPPPWPGELGQRIFDNISAEAWKLWEDRMKMILNEYRLMPWQKEAQELVAKHMEDFFFGEGAALPPGYVPQQGAVART